MMQQRAKLLLTVGGGHGSSFLITRLNAIGRPDQSFCRNEKDHPRYQLVQDGNVLPLPGSEISWRRRTGMQLRMDITKEKALVDLFGKTDKWIVLTGACSYKFPLLYRNGLKAICIMRHPLDAYVSLFHNRRPEVAKPFGGFKDSRAIEFWAGFWNAIVEDVTLSKAVVVRYEYLYEECQNEEILKAVGNDWYRGRRSHAGMLPDEQERLLFDAVKTRFFRYYDSWE